VDAKHGWRVVEPDRGCCSPIVQATENGGRTWRPIFPGNGGNTLDVLRMSRRSGLVSVIWLRTYPDTYWTRDNGRHWYLTDWRVLSPPYAGRGNVLYRWNPGVISRIRPWPPRGSPRCRRFVVQLGAKVCKGQVHNGGMRELALMRTPDGHEFQDFRLIYDGFIALAYPRTPWEAEPWTPSVAIRPHGGNRIANLPPPELGLDQHVYFARLQQPNWPRLAVVGRAGPNWRCDPGDRCATVHWQTADGGRTWSVTTTARAG
jgi:hypothetical protein